MKIQPFNGEVFFHVIISDDRALMDGRIVEPGRTYHAMHPRASWNQEWSSTSYEAAMEAYNAQEPRPCVWGMHASNGLFWYPTGGCWICLVRLWKGRYHGSNKSVAQRRKVIAMRQITGDADAWMRKFRLSWISALAGKLYLGDGDPQGVANWILAKPYKNIVAP